MKPHGSTPIRPKVFASLDEITQGIEKLRSRVVQVEELKKDGLPYRDAFRVTTEFQIRDTIREIFGEFSPEYHEHQNLQIKATSHSGINETVSLLQNLILTLEDKRLALLGIRQRPPAAPTTETNRATKEPFSQTPPIPTSHDAPPAAKTRAQASSPVRPVPTQQITPPVSPEVKRPLDTQTATPANASPPQRTQPRPTALKLSAEVDTLDASDAKKSPTAQAPAVTLPPPTAFPSTGAPQPMQACPAVQGGQLEDTVKRQEPSTATPVSPAGEKSTRDALNLIRKLCSRFHKIARQLRHRGDDRPTLEVEDEIDVQDVLHALLYIDFDDIQLETWTPSYAQGASRTDLLLKRQGIIVLVKRTKQGGGAKLLIDQLSVDVQRYSTHPECKAIVCFVYDPEGRIGNPKGLEAELSREQNGRQVMVIISPT